MPFTPERSSLTQGVQVGVETTPGTAVPADLLFSSIGITPRIQAEFNAFRPMGQKYKSIVVPGKEWSSASISGAASYTELPFLFECCVHKVEDADVESLGAGAYRRTYESLARTEDEIRTLTVEQGGAVRAQKFTHFVGTRIELEFTREHVEVTGDAIGKRLQDDITMTASPTGLLEKPIIPRDVSVYLDPTGAALGSTKLLRALRATWRMGDRFNPLWVLDAAQDSFVTVVEREPTCQVELLLEADEQGMELLTTMRAGDSYFVRILAEDDEIVGAGHPWTLQLDSALKVTDIGEFSDEDGVYAITWTGDMVYDPTWGHAMQAKIINDFSTLETEFPGHL